MFGKFGSSFHCRLFQINQLSKYPLGIVLRSLTDIILYVANVLYCRNVPCNIQLILILLALEMYE